MRILHLLTWVAPGNPFGGPVSVAVNLCNELANRGHVAELAAARPNKRAFTSEGPDNDFAYLFRGLRVLPGAGFSSIVAPQLPVWLLRRARSFDVVHVHVCRDLITLPSARLVEALGVPVVLQSHGMVDHSNRRSANLLDSLLTRATFRRAAHVLALTESERGDIAMATGLAVDSISILTNGVPVGAFPSGQPKSAPEVLFCSRLASRKRPIAFALAAKALSEQGLQATYAIVGADEGEAAAVDRIIAQCPSGNVKREPALPRSAVGDRIATADILVLPSIDEPYPMVVLEAMSIGRPVIVTDSCGLAQFVEQHQAGIVIPGDDSRMLQQAIDRLASDPVLRSEMGTNARLAAERHLSISRVVDTLEWLYETAINKVHATRPE